MPHWIPPMAAQLADALPRDDDNYGIEFKFDGFRAIVHIQAGKVRILSRNGLDMTGRFPELRDLAKQLDGRNAILDGELIAFDENGKPSFQGMQHRTGIDPDHGFSAPRLAIPISLAIFDLLYYQDTLLLLLPYVERRERLEGLGLTGGHWSTPPYSVGHGAAMLAASQEHGMEGVVAKRLRSTYQPGKRGRDWIKVKVRNRQEFLICGWIPGEGKRAGTIGALVLGCYEDGQLAYAGRVGTGFTEVMLAELFTRLRPLEQPEPVFARRIPYEGRVHHVRPELVADVAFLEQTSDGELRHPSFQGLRSDKDPRDVIRERPLGTADIQKS